MGPIRRGLRGLTFVASLAAPGARADLEVGVPPGPPLSWWDRLPVPNPVDPGGAIWTASRARRAREGARKGSTSVRERPRPRMGTEAYGSFDAMRAAGVTTVDITGHLRWTVRGEVPPSRRMRVPGIPALLAWPPPVGDDLYWQAMAAYARALLHPALVSRAECAAFLLELGAPAREVSEKVTEVEPLRGMARSLLGRIRPVPPSPPSFKPGRRATPLESMLEQLAIVDLASGHPYSAAGPFAPRLLSLGPAAQAAIVACSRSPHPLLRANAAAVLARFPSVEVVERLASLATGDRDPVVRARALEGLGLLPADRSVAVLVRFLSTRRFEPETAIALRGLGRTGRADACAAILRFTRANASSPEVLWTAIPALGRTGRGDPKALDLARKIRAGLLRTGRTALDPRTLAGIAQPDCPDPSGTRLHILLQLATIALARLGDADAAGAIAGWARGRDPVDPRAGRLPPGRRCPNAPVLRGVENPCLPFWLETLAHIGPKGVEVLRGVAGNGAVPAETRARAIDELRRAGAGAAAFEALLEKEKAPARCRAAALRALDELDAGRASAIARGVVRVAAGVPFGEKEAHPGSNPRDPAFAVELLEALRILQESGAGEPGALRALIGKAAQGAFEPPPERRPRGRVPPGAARRRTFTARPPVEEAAILALGATGDAESAGFLAAILRGTRPRGRGEAALALGAIGGREAATALVGALEDADGWVRYQAFRALEAMGGASFACNWLFGDSEERAPIAARWKAWLAETFPAPELPR